MQAFIDSLPGMLSTYGLKIITAIAIFLLGKWIAGGVRRALNKGMTRKGIEEVVVAFVCSVAYALVLAFVAVAALGQLGVQTSSIVAILGASALAVGLALQGSLSNLASGVLLMMTRPFKTGDFIESAGNTGSVVAINLLATTLKSPDNKKIIVPNSTLTGNPITNYTAEGIRRIDLKVGVSYGSDLRRAREVLMDELKSNPGVLPEPAPVVGVMEMADSSVNLVVRPWVNTPNYWTVYFQLTESIKLRLDAEGIEIPFPQRDVHLYNK